MSVDPLVGVINGGAGAMGFYLLAKGIEALMKYVKPPSANGNGSSNAVNGKVCPHHELLIYKLDTIKSAIDKRNETDEDEHKEIFSRLRDTETKSASHQAALDALFGKGT